MKVDAAIDILLTLLSHVDDMQRLISEARKNGQTDLSEEQVDMLVAADNASRQRLQDAINKKRGG